MEKPTNVQIERRGHVLVLTIHRPHVLNAIDERTDFELQAAFDMFAADPHLRVAVLTGAGERSFSTGNDMKEAAARPSRRYPERGLAGLTRRLDLFKPIIAAVNGHCIGGGFEIALACDLIVASRHATFALNEPRVARAGLMGGAWRLASQLPSKQAMGLLLTGRTVSAEEGLSIGFVTECVEGPALPAALRWAEQICECAPAAVRATKQIALMSVGRGLAQITAEQEGYTEVKAMRAGKADIAEALVAFAQRRRPHCSDAAANGGSHESE